MVNGARSSGAGLAIATALVLSLAGCLGAVPDLLTTDAAPDATQVAEADTPEASSDATLDVSTGPGSSTDGGPEPDALIEGGPGCFDGGPCSPGPCQLGAVSCGCTPGFTSCGPGVCVDTTSDGANCGACGHGCQGGTCVGSKCQPVTVGAFSLAPLAIAVDSKYVYAAIGGGNPGTGRVERCGLSGCPGGSETLTQTQPQGMRSIVANSAGVFWTGIELEPPGSPTGSAAGCAPASCANGTVITYAKSATEPPGQIASDGTNVYYTVFNNGGPFTGVQSCPVAGCPSGGPTTVEDGGHPFCIATGGGSVYWTDGYDPSSIKKCPSTGCVGVPANLNTSAPTGSFVYVAADSSNVYWLDSAIGLAYECPSAGCPSAGPIVLGPAGKAVNLAVDSSYVYWASAANTVVRCAIGGCSNIPTTILSGITVNPQIVLVDSTTLYWFNGATLTKVAK